MLSHRPAGSGTLQPLAKDASSISGALRRLTSGLGSGALLASPLLRQTTLGALARLDSSCSQGAGEAVRSTPQVDITSNAAVSSWCL